MHAGRVLRRHRRLAGRIAHRVVELPGAVLAPRGRGLGARPHRHEAPADHPARLGRLVRDQVGGLRLRRPARARVAEAGRTGALDGGSARAPGRERPRDRARHRGRGGLRRRRGAARPALRRRRGRRRLHPRARAGHPLPDARLPLGRLPGAERRGAEPRRADEPLPDRAEPRLRRPAALPRARADDGDRGAAPRDRPGGARAPQPRRGVPVPDAERRALRLRRLRRLSRRRARARGLRGAPRGAGGRARARNRARLHRRAVDLEHGLHHPGADRRGACGRAAEIRQRRGLHDLDLAGGRDHRPALDDAAGPGAPHRRSADRRRPARRGAIGDRGAVRAGHLDERLDGRLGQLLVALRGRRRRRDRGGGGQARGEDRGDPRAPRRGAFAPPRRRNGALEPRVAAARDGARTPGHRVLRRTEPRPARRRGPSRLLRGPRLRRRRRRGRGRSRHRAGADPRLRLRPRRGPAPEPADRRRADPRRLRARRGRGPLRADRLRRGRDAADGDVHGLRLPDRARPAAGEDRAPRDALAVRARRKGARRGEHDVGPGGDRERGRGRARPRATSSCR